MKGSVSFLPVSHDPFADLPKGELGVRQGPMSWTDWLPFVKEAVKLYGKEKLGEVLGAVTAPGEAMAGRLDPMTPEGLRRVQALAGLAMAGPPVPKGAVASGWQFPFDKALQYWKDSPIHKKNFDLISYMKEFGKQPHEAAKDLGLPTSVADSVLAFYKPEAEFYIHPHDAPFTLHPATYSMSEPEVLAAGELLEMLKNYPEVYKSPIDAVKVVKDFARPDEYSTIDAAAKKLEEWSGPHGFKFQEEPKAVEPVVPKGWESVEPEPAPKSNPFAYNQRPTVSIEEAFYPVNWADLHSTIARPGQTATGEYANRLRRAESLGFNTNFPVFHGSTQSEMITPENPAAGLWGPEAEQAHSFFDLSGGIKDFERGIFTSDSPEIAALYSGGSDAPQLQGQTFKLFANPKTTLAVDWSSVAGQPSYDSSLMHHVIEAAHKKGADALIVQGMGDIGGLQNQYIFLKPNVLRSPFARFDPKFAESANLTRSGGLGLPLLVPVDHDPFAEPQL